MNSKWTRRTFLENSIKGGLAVAGGTSLPTRIAAKSGHTVSSEGTPWFVGTNGYWADKLSQPQFDVKFEFDVKIPMRDGVKLNANIWRPNAPGKFPVVVMYTPYDSTSAWAIDDGKYFAPRGYVSVAIDARGRYGSEGKAYLYWHTDWRKGGFEGQDVYDALAWLGKQPWSTGKIGMHGPSYLAMVQWLGAYLDPPYLAALIPENSVGDHYRNVFPGGAFQLGNSLLFMTMLGGNRTNSDAIRTDFLDWKKVYSHLPLRTADEAFLSKKIQVWKDFMDHPDHDEYWRFSVADWAAVGELTPGKYPRVKVPTLNITGWFDQVQQDTINNYMEMVRYGPEELRHKHQLIVGPWRHFEFGRKVGDLDFGPEAAVNRYPIFLRWFDYWLKGIDNGMMEEPPVNLFVMGANRWRSEKEWPSHRARDVKFYFDSTGPANSRFGQGRLSTDLPRGEQTDSFIYDPEHPVPTYGDVEPWQDYLAPDVDGPRDRRSIECRSDILVYTSEALEREVEVRGRIFTKLYAASTARDTDFTAKVIDVYPDGSAQLLVKGIIRARYRESFERQVLISPGEIYEYTIDVTSLSHVFMKEHRIRVEISSSDFPEYDRNPNTGHKFGEDAETQKAKQTIYHNIRYPSHIVLPVVAD
jgi:putative CocE/NonD family hydrolase